MLKLSHTSFEELALVILSPTTFVHSAFAFSFNSSNAFSHFFRFSKLYGVCLLLKLFFALFTLHLAFATSLFHQGGFFLLFCDFNSIRGTASTKNSVYMSINASVMSSIE